MYLSNLDIIAVCIALIAQMTINVILFMSSRRWEQQYKNTARLLKQERAATRSQW
jgi:hypothetical protein